MENKSVKELIKSDKQQKHDSALAKSDDLIREEGNQFLTFYVGTELFAVNILELKELIEYSSVTFIPMMSKFIHGVINLRGNVIPVVDLSVRIERDPCKITKKTSIVFVEVDSDDGKINIGMLVDAVAEVVDIPIKDIEKAPAFGARIRSDFIQEIGKIKDKFVIILKLATTLKIDELAKIEDSATLERRIKRSRSKLKEIISTDTEVKSLPEPHQEQNK